MSALADKFSCEKPRLIRHIFKFLPTLSLVLSVFKGGLLIVPVASLLLVW